MDLYTAGWLLWFLWFAIEEGLALCGPRNGRTLSEHIWLWASIKDKGTMWRLRRVILLSGMVWLLVHFMTGGQV